MKNKFLAVFIALAVWGVSFCTLPAQAHACCQQGNEARMAKLMLCCMGQPLATESTKGIANSLPTDLPAVIASHPLSAFDYGLSAQHQSITDRAYLKDQSGRYLELRVLLN